VRSAARRRSPVTRWTTALAGALLLAGCTSVVPGSAEYAPPGAEGHVVRQPCPGSEFECITLGVPADHFADRSPTWDVTFALHRGTVDSRGVFVIATGGPGFSGIAEADDRLATMAPEITDHYDVVFFDQRGIGRSEPFRCDRTLSSDTGDPIAPSSTADQRDVFAQHATRLAQDCFAAGGVDPADAGRYATRQAVEDLESFRDWLDADQLVLYGESYGTQFQQAYAAAHPDRVAALILDGVVDLATDDLTFGIEAAQAYSGVLAATLTACDTVRTCAADAPGSAAGQYDALAAQLARGPESYEFPLADGTTEQRELTLEGLQSAAAWSMSDPRTREQLQQALNAAANDNDVPLARIAAAGAGADPDTGVVYDDPAFSTALYYAVECADYDVVPPGSTGRGQLDVWLDAAHTAGIDHARLGEIFYQDVPCLFWPEAGATPPAPATAELPYPLLLLTADTDPNTPTQQAQRVFSRAVGDVAMVVQQGGPHVVYGRGVRCVDQAVDTLITTGQLAAAGVTTCPGPVAVPYVQNAPPTAAGYTDAPDSLDLLRAATLGNVGYTGWDRTGELAIGCDAGGSARYELDGHDLHVRLENCAWTPGVPVDGDITVAGGGTGNARGDLKLPFADLTFDGAGRLSGTFRGAPVH
jgi:pimeloyl-ACP methyl ester carboxylesterase